MNAKVTIAMVFIIIIGFVSVFAYIFAPDDSQYANQMHLSIHSKRPGFKVLMLTFPTTIETDQSYFNKVFFGNKKIVRKKAIHNLVDSNHLDS